MNKQELMKELKDAHEYIDDLTDMLANGNYEKEERYSEGLSFLYKKERMPKAMSEWIEKQIIHGETRTVYNNGAKGHVMKSRDCTIVFFPSWNCDKQFNDISNSFD